MRSLAPLPLLFALGSFGCASAPAPEESAALPDVAAKGSPYAGLEAPAAVERFLELAIPYDMGSAHLVDELATSYEASLAAAVTAQLERLEALGGTEAPVPAAEDDPELQRLLLVRVGCRWAERAGEAGAERRRQLLFALGEAVGDVTNPQYRRWLRSNERDRACLEAIAQARSQAVSRAERGPGPR